VEHQERRRSVEESVFGWRQLDGSGLQCGDQRTFADATEHDESDRLAGADQCERE